MLQKQHFSQLADVASSIGFDMDPPTTPLYCLPLTTCYLNNCEKSCAYRLIVVYFYY